MSDEIDATKWAIVNERRLATVEGRVNVLTERLERLENGWKHWCLEDAAHIATAALKGVDDES